MTGEKESRIKEQYLSKVSSFDRSEEKIHGTDVMAGEKESRIKEQHLSKVSSFERSEEKMHGTEGIVREGKRAIDQNNNEVGSVKSDHPKSADSTEDNR